MSDEKFTKGPWEVSGKTYEGDGTAGYGVSSVNYKSFIAFCSAWFDRGEPEKHLEIDKANAYLIAMSPEMYEELERDLNDQLKAQKAIEGKLVDEWLNSGIKRKQKILAKARGEHDT